MNLGLVITILSILVTAFAFVKDITTKKSEQGPSFSWRITTFLALAVFLASGSAEVIKFVSDTSREKEAKAQQEQLRADILTSISGARDALESIKREIASRPSKSVDSIRPQLEQLDSLLQTVANDTAEETADRRRLEQARASLVEIEGRIESMASGLQAHNMDSRAPRRTESLQTADSDFSNRTQVTVPSSAAPVSSDNSPASAPASPSPDTQLLMPTEYDSSTVVRVDSSAVVRVTTEQPGRSGSVVRGNVHFEGKAPAPKPISMASDPVCAKQHPSPVFAEEIVADSKGNLQNAIVFVAEGLGNVKFDLPPVSPRIVEQKGCIFQPHVMALAANHMFELVNNDPTSHNVHAEPANNREFNIAEPPGTKKEETFAREEIAIPVKCNVHPWMRAYIAVFKHPFFSVTGKDGSFNLSNLPPGTYTIKAWHEKLGTATQTMTIGAGETIEIDFTFTRM